MLRSHRDSKKENKKRHSEREDQLRTLSVPNNRGQATTTQTRKFEQETYTAYQVSQE